MKKIFTLLLLLVVNLSAQSDSDFIVYPKLKFGLLFSAPTSWYLDDNKYHKIVPGFSYGISIATKNFDIVDNTSISIELDVNYGSASTGINTYREKNSEFKTTSLPIVLWGLLKSSGKIAPYVKVGIGAERTQCIQTLGNFPEYSYDLKEWFFCWAIGAGVEINYWSPIQFSIYVDGIIKEKSITRIFPDSRNGYSVGGITLGYKF